MIGNKFRQRRLERRVTVNPDMSGPTQTKQQEPNARSGLISFLDVLITTGDHLYAGGRGKGRRGYRLWAWLKRCVAFDFYR